MDYNGNYHGEDDIQKARLNVYFNEASSGKWVPRSVNVDLEPGTIDAVRNSRIGNPVSYTHLDVYKRQV